MSYEDWKESLKQELKTDQVDQVPKKTSLEGVEFPILAQTNQVHHLSFSRAPLSIVINNAQDATPEMIQSWYELGVGDFIWDETIKFDKSQWSHFFKSFKGHFFFQEMSDVNPPCIKVISAREWVLKGISQEDQLLILCQKVHNTKEGWVEIYLDDQSFKNIALIRALRMLINDTELKILGRVHQKSFSWLDPENNILRNTTALISGYLSGVDAMESVSHHQLTINDEQKNQEASWLSLSSQLILQTESNLQFSTDPGLGSETIESLTAFYIQYAKEEKNYNWEEKSKNYKELILKKMRTRKIKIPGVNDVPLVNVPLPKVHGSPFFRWASEFENLRLEFRHHHHKIKVGLLSVGIREKNQARYDFAKNYFELLGEPLVETHHDEFHSEKINLWKKENHLTDIVLVAQDEWLLNLLPQLDLETTVVATKLEYPKLAKIFYGMDVIEFFHHWLLKKGI